MRVHEIIWIAEVEEKVIRKHGVWPDEVEQVFQHQPHVRFMERGHEPGEDLHAAFGQTAGGRYLAVFFILKRTGAALIITAREMTKKEKRSYGKR
jgi:uncharacterized DUF497 family protein